MRKSLVSGLLSPKFLLCLLTLSLSSTLVRADEWVDDPSDPYGGYWLLDPYEVNGSDDTYDDWDPNYDGSDMNNYDDWQYDIWGDQWSGFDAGTGGGASGDDGMESERDPVPLSEAQKQIIINLITALENHSDPDIRALAEELKTRTFVVDRGLAPPNEPNGLATWAYVQDSNPGVININAATFSQFSSDPENTVSGPGGVDFNDFVMETILHENIHIQLQEQGVPSELHDHEGTDDIYDLDVMVDEILIKIYDESTFGE